MDDPKKGLTSGNDLSDLRLMTSLKQRQGLPLHQMPLLRLHTKKERDTIRWHSVYMTCPVKTNIFSVEDRGQESVILKTSSLVILSSQVLPKGFV